MDISLKHRLVGALVLVALAIVFLPLIFDGKESVAKIKSKIPPKPIMLADVVLTNQRDTNENSGTVSGAQEVSPKPAVDSESNNQSEVAAGESDTPEPPTKQAFNELAWILRVGTFTKFENAQRIRESLHNKDRNAFLKTITYKNGRQSYQVFLGPDISKQNVEQWQKDLQASMNIAAIIEPFNPSIHTL